MYILNELSVNGKPVEDDELEDDYTQENDNDDEDNEEDNQTTNLDLNPGDDETDQQEENEEDEIDDDYTVQNPDDDETGDGNDENNEGLDLNPEEDQNGDQEDSDTNTDDNQENEDDQNSEEQPQNDETEDGDDDYTQENPDSDTEDESENMDDTSGSDNEGDQNELEEKIKQTEAEIFNTLSDQEKAIRNKQLIENYITTKNTIKLFIEKVRTINITRENKDVLHFVESNLLDLSKIITDYIIYRYSNRSYIQNFVFYQQILLTITQLKDIIVKLSKEDDKKL